MGGAWELWIILIVRCIWSNGLPLKTNNVEMQVIHLRLMTEAGESEAIPRRGTPNRENEIAAIFKGVAYGAPTQGRPNFTTIIPVIFESVVPTHSSTTVQTYTNIEIVVNPFVSKVSMQNEEGGKKNAANGHNHSSLVSRTAQITKGGLKDVVDFTTVHHNLPLTTAFSVRDTNRQKVETRGFSEKGILISDNHSFRDLQRSLGLAWWVHLYVSVGLFSLLGVVALCSMARVAIATHLLPRSQYLVVHVLIFSAGVLRSIHILHDANGHIIFLPITLLKTIEDFGWPCLSAALAFVLVSVLKEWKYPKHPNLSLALSLVTILQLIALLTAHISVVFLMKENIAIALTTRAAAVAFGGAVGISGMWAVWRESREFSRITDIQFQSDNDNHPSVAHPARLVLTAALTQSILAGIHVYKLLVPLSTDGYMWVWWSCLSVSRGLELLVGGTLITAAALTLSRPLQCCVIVSCCEKRPAEIVHPTEIKMIHPIGVYTLQSTKPKNEHAQTIAVLSLSNSQKEKKDHKSLDYVTSDFQLVWNHSRQKTRKSSATAQPVAFNDSFLLKGSHSEYNEVSGAHFIHMNPRYLMEPSAQINMYSSTLPRHRMYLPPPSLLQFQEDMQSSQDRYPNYTSKSSTLLSGSSGSSKQYYSPQIPLRASRSWDELSTSHIYEDLTKAKHDSIEEAMSDISDLNSDDLNSDFINVFINETGSSADLRACGNTQALHKSNNSLGTGTGIINKESWHRGYPCQANHDFCSLQAFSNYPLFHNKSTNEVESSNGRPPFQEPIATKAYSFHNKPKHKSPTTETNLQMLFSNKTKTFEEPTYKNENMKQIEE